MGGKREKGISLIEVLVAASLFTIVILGITQTVLLMHRYSRANLCKYKAHLMATSYFESLLCDTHPYDLNKNVVKLRDIGNPSEEFKFKYDIDNNELDGNVYKNLHEFETSIYEDGNKDLKVFMLLTIQESPLCKIYKIDEAKDDDIDNSEKREKINPPEGFQSLRLKYWYTSPLMTGSYNDPEKGSEAYLAGFENNELYAIRPLNPDDPEYDV